MTCHQTPSRNRQNCSHGDGCPRARAGPDVRVGRMSSACHASPWVALLLLDCTPVLPQGQGVATRFKSSSTASGTSPENLTVQAEYSADSPSSTFPPTSLFGESVWPHVLFGRYPSPLLRQRPHFRRPFRLIYRRMTNPSCSKWWSFVKT